MTQLTRIFEIASRDLPAAGIDCLLVGGFAVNHYGYTRNTLVVDFMIVAQDLDEVRRIMRAAGFINVDIHDNVAFFSVPDEDPRVDFLRVDKSTMDKLLTNAVRTSVQGHALRIPCLKDLMAMKIFAFSQSTERRMGKDLPDIAYLTAINNLDAAERTRGAHSQAVLHSRRHTAGSGNFAGSKHARDR